MKFVMPSIGEKSFHCPLCSTYAHMNWQHLTAGNSGCNLQRATCSCCSNDSIWKITEYEGFKVVAGFMIYPDVNSAPLPEVDMPDNVKIDYIEAASIYNKSPRGSAALLRLALQKFCKHLGESGENINQDIRSLAAKNIIPPLVVKVTDTVRIVGNNAVHPGEMNEADFDSVASKMFDLLNFIVKKGITEPKELEGLYELIPEGPRKSAEAKDIKSRENA